MGGGRESRRARARRQGYALAAALCTSALASCALAAVPSRGGIALPTWSQAQVVTPAGTGVAGSPTCSAPTDALPGATGTHVAAHLVSATDGHAFVAADVAARGGPPRRFGGLMGVAIAPDGTIGAAVQIALAGEDPYQASFGIDAHATITAAYTSGATRISRVLVRTMPAGGRFGPPTQLSPRGVRSGLLRLLVRPSGFTVAMIRMHGRAGPEVGVYVRETGGAFRRVMLLGATAAADPAVAASPDGRVLVAWSAPTGSRRRAIEEQGWPGRSRARRVGTVRARPPLFPGVGLVSGGGALIAWQRPVGQRAVLEAATRSSATARFAPPIALTPVGAPNDAGDLHVDPGPGEVLLSADQADTRGHYRATLHVWTPGSGFQPPRIASPAGEDAFQSHSAVGGDRILVAWQAESGIDAAAAEGAGPFSAPARLSDLSRTVVSTAGPYVAVDGRGVALAVWIDYDDTGDRVELARCTT
jgi:hypothetical protein